VLAGGRVAAMLPMAAAATLAAATLDMTLPAATCPEPPVAASPHQPSLSNGHAGVLSRASSAGAAARGLVCGGNLKAARESMRMLAHEKEALRSFMEGAGRRLDALEVERQMLLSGSAESRDACEVQPEVECQMLLNGTAECRDACEVQPEAESALQPPPPTSAQAEASSSEDGGANNEGGGGFVSRAEEGRDLDGLRNISSGASDIRQQLEDMEQNLQKSLASPCPASQSPQVGAANAAKSTLPSTGCRFTWHRVPFHKASADGACAEGGDAGADADVDARDLSEELGRLRGRRLTDDLSRLHEDCDRLVSDLLSGFPRAPAEISINYLEDNAKDSEECDAAKALSATV